MMHCHLREPGVGYRYVLRGAIPAALLEIA